MTARERLSGDLQTGEAARAARRSYARLASASHEIRTALGSIRELSELLLATRLDPTQERYVQALKAVGEGLLDIVDDVADLTRLGGGRVAPSGAPFALRPLLNQIETVAVQKAAAKGVRFTTAVAADVPATAAADAGLLRRVLLALIGAAVNRTEQGEIRLQVALADGPSLRFDITDSGIGFAPEDVPHIFTRLDRYGEHLRSGGADLRHAVARDLVASMGGEIGAESSPGVGSRFWFAVPLVPALPAVAVAAVAPARRLRILVAEDNEISRLYLASTLTRAGHSVDLAANGAKAVAMARRGGYDAILMDVRLPVMDGVEATRTIRALGGAAASVPIIALTAEALAGARERFLAAGMTDYVSKPIDGAALAAALSRAAGAPVDLAAPAADAPANLVDLARRLDAFLRQAD
ncbi:MAG: response regulator [Rhodospirillales bacterium]